MPQTIVTVSVANVAELIEEGKPLEALSPTNFGQQQNEMQTVYDYAAALPGFELRILGEGLKHALDDEHDSTVTFATESMTYETGAVGLEIEDTAVSEDEEFGPLTIIFIQPGQGPKN